jgi:membrane protein
MRVDLKSYGIILKTAAVDWWNDKAPRLGAALAYYSLFSLAPLLVLITAMAGIFFGREAVQGRLVDELGAVIGKEAGEAIQSMIANARKPATSTVATIVGVAMLLIGASGVFGQLQDALNTIWEVKARKGRGIKGVLKDRFLSFTMVLVIGFLLLTSLVVSTALAAIGDWMANSIEPGWAAFWHVVNILASFGVITVLFALIFKILPDAKIPWRYTWFGAAFTSLLFALGKLGISFYLSHSTVASVYGAAGSLVVILIWMYYSAQILLFGAEVTQAQYCLREGCKAEPKENAVKLGKEERELQGMEEKPLRQSLSPT